MKYFAYVVKRDFGFAPNPFHGVCTLATCKPMIRKQAKIDDWVFGLGSNELKCRGRLIYAMQVSEKMTYDKYWEDERFSSKKPVVHGSAVRMHGDNIYHKDKHGSWHQEDSQHSNEEGKVHRKNLEQDTQSNNVLVSRHFYYFGREHIPLPPNFKNCVKKLRQNFKYIPAKYALELISMLEKYPPGYCGRQPLQLQDGFR